MSTLTPNAAGHTAGRSGASTPIADYGLLARRPHRTLALHGAACLTGGVPLVRDGEVVGAVGTSGETPDEDEAVSIDGAARDFSVAQGRAPTCDGARLAAEAATAEAAARVSGRWRYADARVDEIDFVEPAGTDAPGPLGPGTVPNRTYGGIWVLSPGGEKLDLLELPESPHNLAWGDADGRALYITAPTSIYRMRLP